MGNTALYMLSLLIVNERSEGRNGFYLSSQGTPAAHQDEPTEISHLIQESYGDLYSELQYEVRLNSP